MYTNLLVPTDGSKLSSKAVAHAIGLAKALNARIAVLYVTPPFTQESLFDGGKPSDRACVENGIRRDEGA